MNQTIFFKRTYLTPTTSLCVTSLIGTSGACLTVEDLANTLNIDTNYVFGFSNNKNEYFATNILSGEDSGMVHCIEPIEIANLFNNLAISNPQCIHDYKRMYYIITSISHSVGYEINTSFTSKALCQYYVDAIATHRKVASSSVYTEINELVKKRYGIDIFEMRNRGECDSIPDYISRNPSFAYNILNIIVELGMSSFKFNVVNDYMGANSNYSFDHGIDLDEKKIDVVEFV